MLTCKPIAARMAAAFFVVGAAVFAAAPATAQEDCGDDVVLGFRDTLSTIARRCGVTVDEIMAANPLLPSPRFIFPGLRIRMPDVAPPPPPPPANVRRYQVRPGDTLFGIARANNVPMTEILRLNPDIDGRTMRVGDVVLLPGGAPGPVSPPPPSNTRRYIVRLGDTLFSIARANGVRVRELLDLNPNIDARTLRTGDVVILPAAAPGPGPVSPPPQTNTRRYIVRPGDTLFSIARANDMRVRDLLDLNPNIDPNTLRVGDVVLLRGGIVPPAPPPSPAPPPAQPPRIAAIVTPESGPPGTVVSVAASGFPASTTLKLLAGTEAGSLAEFDRVTTDKNGTTSANVRIPDWAAGAGSLVFAFETIDGRLRALSPTFRVGAAQPAGAVSIRGTLTSEGVECPAMRGDDGTLYTLAPRSATSGLGIGQRVRVEGRSAQTSFCQQGTTINVDRVVPLR